ncbi:dicarboxylate/amino acid:cation symporter [Halosquirtibacter xylanolyticus]|uniref:dicarboxylate/amino acid:cation symporter n=1 Tax=Halosquirtibacter xylanolyticus TaxID=3374599 RepID=UPI00374A1106|nr:dicarboxylate/amino acid:cation symporter [Prolixibacteraceae bacterium]
MIKVKISIHWQILIALCLSVLFGYYLKEYVQYVSWMGDIFLRSLKMIVIPLVLTSVASGIAKLGETEGFKRLGFKTLLYYITTSVFAILGGLIFTNLLKPGVGVSSAEAKNEFAEKITSANSGSIGETLLHIVPDNIFSSFYHSELLSIIFFAIVIGIFIPKLRKKDSDLLVGILDASFELFMKITMFIIKLAPFGIFGLISKVVADQNDLMGMFSSLGIFMVTVLSALFVHFVIVIPLMVKFIGKANPVKHFDNMSTALLTAFSTASSAAALPLTMEATHEESGVSSKITNFTLPVGATVNMDGTAIYICAVVMFVAQMRGLDLTFYQQFIILISALLTSIGTAAIPMGSLVVITIILDLLHLPIELVAVVLPVDRLLDMFRTATNVWSDSCGAVIVAKTEGEELNV